MLYRVEISNELDNVDFYSVAVSHKLIKMAFDSLSLEFPNSYTNKEMNYGGFKLKVKLVGDNGEIRYLNLITTDAKSSLNNSSDKDEGNSLFPVSRKKDGTKIIKNGIVEYHDNLFEFVTGEKPGETFQIFNESNLNYDKLFNLPTGTNLKVDEVYIYISNPLVSGNYMGLDFDDFGKYSKEEL